MNTSATVSSPAREEQAPNPRGAVLDPVSRTTEILFGLIMVLTFTCSLSVASAGESDVREMLVGALGCNIAWGLIDGFFYILSAAAQRGREELLLRKLKATGDRSVAHEIFDDVIPQSILRGLSARSLEELRTHLLSEKVLRDEPLITWTDLKAALLIFALVFLTTFPVSIPFMLTANTELALRVSNAIALVLLFALGFSLGKYAGRRPIIWGIGMAVIGAWLVGVTMALGG